MVPLEFKQQASESCFSRVLQKSPNLSGIQLKKMMTQQDIIKNNWDAWAWLLTTYEVGSSP